MVKSPRMVRCIGGCCNGIEHSIAADLRIGDVFLSAAIQIGGVVARSVYRLTSDTECQALTATELSTLGIKGE